MMMATCLGRPKDGVVNLLDVLVGELLRLLLALALVVGGDVLGLEQFLDVTVGIAADVADRDLGLLGLLVQHLDQIATALLGERGQRHADDGSGGGRVEAQVGLADGLVDGVDGAPIPGGDDQRARVLHRDARALRQRRRVAVVVHHDVFEQAGLRAPGAQTGEVGAERVHALGHAFARIVENVLDHVT
jgi:hypothetical protein